MNYSIKHAVIWHRAGLGDHIVAAGLVRHMSTVYEQITVICHNPKNLPSVQHLFAGLNSVKIITFPETPTLQTVCDYCAQNNKARLLTAMFDDYSTHLPWFEACYAQHGLPYRARYDLWPNPPAGSRAEDVYNQLCDSRVPHVVVHRSSSERERYDIDLPEFSADTKIIEFAPGVSDNIFDWLKVLQTAQQIHVVASSLFCLLDNIGDSFGVPIYFHHRKGYTNIIPEVNIVPFHPRWKIHYYNTLQWTPNTPWDEQPYIAGT